MLIILRYVLFVFRMMLEHLIFVSSSSLLILFGQVSGQAQHPPAGSLATLPDNFEFQCTPGDVGIFADPKYNCQVLEMKDEYYKLSSLRIYARPTFFLPNISFSYATNLR